MKNITPPKSGPPPPPGSASPRAAVEASRPAQNGIGNPLKAIRDYFGDPAEIQKLKKTQFEQIHGRKPSHTWNLKPVSREQYVDVYQKAAGEVAHKYKFKDVPDPMAYAREIDALVQDKLSMSGFDPNTIDLDAMQQLRNSAMQTAIERSPDPQAAIERMKLSGWAPPDKAN